MNITYFFFGAAEVFCDYGNITPLLNLCMYEGIPYSNMKTGRDGVSVIFHLSSLKKLQKRAEDMGIEIRIVKKIGLPHFLSKYKYRFGIFLGIACAAAMIFASRMFVWRIDVSGNSGVTTSEIRKMLEDQGFFVGAYIPGVNTDRIENRILIESDTISWISVNIKGNTACVEVRERVASDDAESDKPANLIAKKAGIVQEVQIFNGLVVANAGKYVDKGDLLVSGLYDSTQAAFRYTRAKGKVFAKTVSEYYVEIPYEYEEKCYTDEEYFDKFLIFFDYSINISKNSGKVSGFYDKIDIVENYCFPDGTPMPFGLRTVRYSVYEKVKKRRSEAEAEELAYFELAQRLAEAAEDTVILKKTVIPQIKDDAFALYCTVVAIEDIACVSEFEIESEGGEELNEQ